MGRFSAATTYVGTVYLVGTDPLAGYLDQYAFSLADGGSATFSGEVLLTPGPQTLYVVDDAGLYGGFDLTVT